MFKENHLENIKRFWPEEAPDIKNVPKYVSKYKNDKIVIKCGGNVLVDSNLFNNFIDDIVILNKLGLTTIIVHGGGPRIKKNLEKSNIKSTFINGLRVTDKKTMEIVEQSLEEFNNEIVDAFTKKSCKTLGVNVSNNNVFIVDQENKNLGFVGKPKKILSEKIQNILEKNLVPVLSPMGLDEKNQKYNINADTAACAIAKSLKSRRLLLMTDVEGVYNLEKKLISEIKPFDIKNLIEWKIVQGGMIPKIKNCVDAVENGVRGVVIIDGRKPHSILHEIFSDKGSGTLIRK